MSGKDSIEARIARMEEKLTRIDNEAEQISEIKSTVESISTKLDERTEHTKEKFSSFEKRVDRLGKKFWGILVAIGVVIGRLFTSQ